MLASRLRLSRQAIAGISASSKAKRAASEHFSVVFAKADSAAEAGCAIIVSKKVSKTAVGRHLLKRRIRAALKDWCQSSYALLVYARAGSAACSFADIANEINALLPRVGASRTM
jgi:ribonuclease P protein component